MPNPEDDDDTITDSNEETTKYILNFSYFVNFIKKKKLTSYLINNLKQFIHIIEY